MLNLLVHRVTTGLRRIKPERVFYTPDLMRLRLVRYGITDAAGSVIGNVLGQMKRNTLHQKHSYTDGTSC